MPGTHRTPPDADGAHLVLSRSCTGEPGTVLVEMATDTYTVEVAPDALPALVAALAAHLTVDARRALTRDLAAQDGDAVVDRVDVRSAVLGLAAVGDGSTSRRLRAAVEAARPTPTPEETR